MPEKVRTPDEAPEPEKALARDAADRVPLLHAQAVVAGYGQGVVLHGASLAIGAGERVGLLGRNGAGKTTLLRTVMGLVAMRDGDVEFDGASLRGRPTFAIAQRGIAYVPQGRELFPEFSVEQNLRLGGLAFGSSDLSPAWAAFPWLRERRHERAGSLSGGQQQQLAIGRAIVSRPRLMLLDEPLEGVQPSVVSEIAASLDALCSASGMALLLVEQNVDVMLSLCTRVAFIERGAVVHGCDAATVRATPSLLERYLGV